MRKIFAVLLGLCLVMSGVAYSYNDYKSNAWASWTNLTTANPAMTLNFASLIEPYRTRDITIINGSTNAIGVDLNDDDNRGDDDPSLSTSRTGRFQLAGSQKITLKDYVCDGLSIFRIGNDASPVSVIVTY